MAPAEKHPPLPREGISANYPLALERAVFHQPLDPGLIRISGSGRIDFIQRQTTNDVSTFGPGVCITTVLTSPKARILDVLTLVPDGDSILAITLPGRGAQTTGFFRSRIFFMDQVTVDDESDRWAQFYIDGSEATAVLTAAGIDEVPGDGSVVQQSAVEEPVWATRRRGLTGPGFHLLTPIEGADSLADLLAGNGAVELSGTTYEALRIEAGLPGPDSELNEAHTPLELGLTDLISANKGCYTGQEVIARQITYDKVVRGLYGVQLASPAAPGCRVLVDGQPSGQLTSAAQSARLGPIGLAVLRKQRIDEGATIEIEHQGARIQAALVPLPMEGTGSER